MGYSDIPLQCPTPPAPHAHTDISRAERQLVRVQWVVMIIVTGLATWHSPYSLHENILRAAVLAVTVGMHPLLYGLVWHQVGIAASPRLSGLLTAADVAIAMLLFFQTSQSLAFAQILFFSVVALAATRYTLARALGITSLVSTLVITTTLMPPAHGSFTTLTSITMGLLLVTYIVGLLRAAELKERDTARSNSALYRQVLGINRELAAINNLVHVLFNLDSPQQVLAAAVPIVGDAMGALRAQGCMWDVDHMIAEPTSAPITVALSAAAAQSGQVRGTPSQAPDTTIDTSYILAIPIQVRESVMAVVEVVLPDSSYDHALVQLLAKELGVGMESALLRQALNQNAILEEKNRIAQELHDTVAQILFSLGLGIEWCRTRVNDPTLADKLAELKRLSAQGNAQIRSAIFTLSSRIGQTNLVQAIQELVSDMGQKYQWQTNVVVVGEPTQPSLAIQNALHRIVREGMINVYKHAGATEVIVSLRFTPTHIVVVVQDNGCGGADQANTAMALPSHHFGLSTLCNQLAELAGELAIYDADDHGLVLRATIPLHLAKLALAPDATHRGEARSA